MTGAKSNASVKSLELALDALEEVATADGEVGVSELAKRLGVAKGSIYRHLQTLVRRGYLMQNMENAYYKLGIKARLLAQNVTDKTDLLSVSQDILKRLSETVGQTVVISAVTKDSLVVLATHLAKLPVEIGVRPGSKLSLHASAQGKVVLAFSRRLSLSRIENRPLTRLTSHTLAKWRAVAEEIEVVRKQEWATAPEEVFLGINGLAAPIFDASGDCIGTIALVGLLQHIPRDPHPNQIEAVLTAARRISSRLGYDQLGLTERGHFDVAKASK